MNNIKTLLSAFNFTNVGNMFLNITRVFEMLITLVVDSCSRKRSFSAMQRLKTWQRSPTGQLRFNGLALMNIHSNKDVELWVTSTQSVFKHLDQTRHLRI